jgi:hypothetical protein
MCTVTFIPVKDQIYFTSNRDEKNWRSAAVPPTIYPFNSGRLLFPKDGNAGGTWIAAHENGNVIVFLNGGWQAHVPSPPYRKSRGLILLDLIDHPTPYNGFLAVNLNNIEPFTAVIFDNQQLFECRWDGEKKYNTLLDTSGKYIWSSCTLYGDEVRTRRSQWFDEWIAKNPEPTQDEILHFHQFTGDGDMHNDLMMNRNGQVFTVSVTSVEVSPRGVVMDYLDTQNRESFSEQLLFNTSIAGR